MSILRAAPLPTLPTTPHGVPWLYTSVEGEFVPDIGSSVETETGELIALSHCLGHSEGVTVLYAGDLHRKMFTKLAEQAGLLHQASHVSGAVKVVRVGFT